jgi:hypothetical protein
MPVAGELKEGGSYQLTGHAGGTISRCEKPHGFAATWEYGGDVSWIEVRLAEVPGGTRLELEHVAHVKDEFWDQFGPGATGLGWDSALLGIANHLADPAAERPAGPELEAWMVSEEGKLMLRLSADAWAEAEVADGGDPEVAKGHADRSYGAYTGG